jgi:hypothetical protein
MSSSDPPSDPSPASSPDPTSSTAPDPSTSGTPASADTINQALDEVKTAFPTDSSLLADLRLDSSDDQFANVTLVLHDQPDAYGGDGIQPILDAVAEQFQMLGIPQALMPTYALEDAANPVDTDADSNSPS